MNLGSAIFLLIAGPLLVVLPRRSAVMPLLLAAAYTTNIPFLEIGPASLSVLRILVLVALLRVVALGEGIANGVNTVDRLLLCWASFLILVSVFHTSDAWTYRMGLVLEHIGVYLLCRVFVRDADDVRWLFGVLPVALVPLALLMLVEKAMGYNFFAIMGGTGEINIREGHVRAYGPFAHSILAGTVGATIFPMALSLWRTQRLRSWIGMGAAAGIVFASTSSGPIMMVAFTVAGLMLWTMRNRMALIRWGGAAAIVALQIVMNDPVYFLMARIDITGGSTGWYRAQLIRSSLEHLGEWWAVGTDYTRHWMSSGIYANANHTDITNHFLAMGVLGGFPLLILFVLVVVAGFRATGTALAQNHDRSVEQRFLVWTVGTMLFGQVMNFWSISLFDQSAEFFYLILAVIGAIHLPVAVIATAKLRPEAWRRQRDAAAAGAFASRRLNGGNPVVQGRTAPARSFRTSRVVSAEAGSGRRLGWSGKPR